MSERKPYTVKDALNALEREQTRLQVAGEDMRAEELRRVANFFRITLRSIQKTAESGWEAMI